MSVEHLNSNENADFSHILSHATKIASTSSLVFVSGQVPIDSSGTLIQGTIQEKTTVCLGNVGNVLRAAGTGWEQVVKVNIFLKNMDDFAAVNQVYEKLVPAPKPARTCIQAAKLPNDVDIEIEAIATA
ncbi:Endoribonuclease L-PSP [Coprinopsis marcescibilis]|uniref:Endoribonuclease L-PSP n=1 Tax=Coprinopsis marcescibilis TaxID=230819 RepID=A0A5C3LC91_COPMA|nr:Endoribonuclease L-PSP [Coprinopsis marcescibilis]